VLVTGETINVSVIADRDDLELKFGVSAV